MLITLKCKLACRIVVSFRSFGVLCWQAAERCCAGSSLGSALWAGAGGPAVSVWKQAEDGAGQTNPAGHSAGSRSREGPTGWGICTSGQSGFLCFSKQWMFERKLIFWRLCAFRLRSRKVSKTFRTFSTETAADCLLARAWWLRS